MTEIIRHNENLVERFFSEFICRKDTALADILFAGDLVYCTPHGTTTGIADIKKFYLGVADAFDDMRFSIHKQMADSTHVITRATIHGLQVRPFWGIPASGRRFALPAVYIFEFAGGRIRQIEVFWDTQTILSQLGTGSPLNLR
jgi:steroid delta-isomerase-like uncharacterized protein